VSEHPDTASLDAEEPEGSQAQSSQAGCAQLSLPLLEIQSELDKPPRRPGGTRV